MFRRPIPPRARRLTPLAALLAALMTLPALTACGGEYVDGGTGLDGDWASVRPPGGGADSNATGGGQTASRLVGEWWHFVTFTSDGSTRTSETFWNFHADGSAERRLVTTNLTHGLSDVLLWRARWRVIGDEVEITYVAPPHGTVRFRWLIERGINGDVLFLDATRFQRLP